LTRHHNRRAIFKQERSVALALISPLGAVLELHETAQQREAAQW
jgi:hypothetical protein